MSPIETSLSAIQGSHSHPAVDGRHWSNVSYVIGFSALLVFSNPAQNAILLQYEPLSYAILALVMMFYPLSGFIADICCGRLKAVVISLAFILSCWIIVLIALSLFMSMSKPDISSLQHNQGLVVAVLCFISLFTFIIGLVGYQPNFIQLGLDQLFEAPSQYLALFIHYAMWVFNIGSLHFMMNFVMAMCFSYENKFALVITQALLPFLLAVLLLMSYWKR